MLKNEKKIKKISEKCFELKRKIIKILKVKNRKNATYYEYLLNFGTLYTFECNFPWQKNYC